MCENCGCSTNYPNNQSYRVEHEHHHDAHEHGHKHPHTPENALQAARNRGMFEAKSICAIRILSTQGSGKSTLIERTIERFSSTQPIYLLSDSPSDYSHTPQKSGVYLLDLSNEHFHELDALLIYRAMKAAQIPDHSLLLIENHVEALSHHALPDLGQIANVLLMSVTEGDSKPLKYPGLFVQSDICVITKTDLLPYVDFNTDKVKTAARSLCPQSSVLEISAKTGKGLEEWLVWFDAMYHKANP